MEPSSQLFLTVGGILLLGLLMTALSHHTFLPRATLLLIFGILIGPEVLHIIPPVFADYFEMVADITLLMVSFLLGGRLTRENVRRSLDEVLSISISAALVTALLVGLGLMALRVPAGIAILLGCIAAATAPAAVYDVVGESGSRGRFSNSLLSIVALDDIWALALFGIGMSLVKALNGGGAGDGLFLFLALKEIGGAVILGLLLGLPSAYLTGRVKWGQPMVTEALGLVLVCGGLALWLGVSYLIAAMVMGAVVANFAKHHNYPFHAIEGIESQLLIVFFVLAGASLELSALKQLGWIPLAYVLLRSAGKIGGARLGSQISRADPATKRYMGMALLPQAGVAIGLALVAAHQFPQYRQVLLSTIISTTVLFEIVGPVFTRKALEKGEEG